MRAATSHLAEVCEINPGTTFAFDADQLCSFVPMEAVDDEFAQIVKFPLRRFDQVAKGYTTFADNDVIVAKITPCMENGKCAVVHKLKNGIGFGSTEFHVLRAMTQVLPEWLFYFWRFPQTRKYAERNMTGTAGQKRVPSSFLQRLEIPVPPLREQERITALLEKADRLRRTRRYARQLSNTFLQSVFLEMFGDTDKEPERWPLCAFDEVCKISDETVDPKEDEFADLPQISSEDIESGSGELRKLKTARHKKIISVNFLVHPSEIVFSKIRPNLRKVAFPKMKALCSADIYPLRIAHDECDLYYILHYLRGNSFSRVVSRIAQSRSNIPKVNREELSALAVPVPPLSLQQKFADIVRRFERLRAQQHEAERQAEHLFQTLLHRAFKAEV